MRTLKIGDIVRLNEKAKKANLDIFENLFDSLFKIIAIDYDAMHKLKENEYITVCKIQDIETGIKYIYCEGWLDYVGNSKKKKSNR